MVEFNPDGSIKLPSKFAKQAEENTNKLKSQKCIKIKREIINFTAPKKCKLNITLSQTITDNRFIDTIYNYFKQKANVPNKITKIGDRQFEIEIGTDFRRCSDCNSLIGRYREFLYGNLIDEKGSCTYQSTQRNFSYEDYFD